MSLLTTDEVRARIETELGDSDLQDAIDQEEADLAARIGALSGSRTETFYPDHSAERLYLRRPTSAVTVTNDGDAVTLGDDDGEYRLLAHGTVLHLVSDTWGEVVTATYSPNDSDRVKRALIRLLRLTLTDSGNVTSERIGQYSYQKAQTPGADEATREAIIRSLLPNIGHTSLRVQSGTSPRPVLPLEV